MTDYTPTTAQVRDAYVRGMRDTFIASAGKHQEEFDRWVQAHHDEVHASVQPPTREQITTAVRHLISRWYDTGGNLQERIADAVLALFAQPTPSAEPECTCYPVPAHLHTTHYGATEPGSTLEPNPDCPVHFPSAAPPSIADMAPGTTFRITDDEDEEIWTVQDNQIAVCATHGVGRYLDVFEPPTIRDVQEPKEERRG